MKGVHDGGGDRSVRAGGAARAVMEPVSLPHLNELDRKAFVAVCGPFFEHSPWVAERAWMRRPFSSLAELHRALVETVATASEKEKLALIRSHPDLVGRLAREGRLTAASTAEQRAAGLDLLTAEEIAQFERLNAAYRERFGFPFIICARENRKDAILGTFPVRLKHSAQEECEASLVEIYKIANLRMRDAITEE